MKKPANQGGKAPAYVQPPNSNEANVPSTANLPHQYNSTDNAWANHMAAKQPGGTRGSSKGAS